MSKPDPERAERAKQWRIWLQGIEDQMDARIKNECAGSMMREFCPEILKTGESREKGETNAEIYKQTDRG